jgi:hypothetical protein
MDAECPLSSVVGSMGCPNCRIASFMMACGAGAAAIRGTNLKRNADHGEGSSYLIDCHIDQLPFLFVGQIRELPSIT